MLQRLSKSFLTGKRFLFSFLLLFFNLLSFAQTGTVTGTVKDQDNKPVDGATITVKQTKIAVVADRDGNFSIKAVKGNTITISSVNFQSQNFVIGDVTNIEIKLERQAGSLNDVVVIGYGSQSKRNLASATSKVSAAEFKNSVITTVDQALQGRATGIQITSSSGEPGATSVIRIRGNNSLSGSNEPLYVIDGFQMPEYVEASSNVYGAFAKNGLYGINPNDIESIEVLKDASATAIYGSRGANGVVLITTKSGKSGDGKIELVNKLTFGSVSKPLKMMTGREFAEVYNEYAANGGNPKPFGNLDTIKTNTNWFDAISRATFREDVSLNISGGTGKTKYYISGNYLNDKGSIIESGLKRASVRANLNSEVNKWYTVSAQISMVRETSQRGVSSNGGWPNGGGLLDAFKTNPLNKLSDVGTSVPSPIPGGGTAFFSNPYIRQIDKQDFSYNDYTILNIGNIFQVASDLKFFVNLGQVQNLTRRKAFFPITTSEGFYSNGIGNYSVANTYSYNVNAYLQYDKLIHNDHKVNFTLGGEYATNTLETISAFNQGFNLPSEGVNNLSQASAQQTNSYKQYRVIQSAFYRGNYSYKGKYILNTSLRLDGASPFSESKKYGLFPSVGVAWNIAEENFMKNVSGITNSKIRASWGVTGSQAIAPYSSLATYGSDAYLVGSSPQTVVFPMTLGNPNLSWEKTKQLNIGFDFSTFSNRITFSFDYYNKKTTGLLQPKLLPSQSGYASITDNYGNMVNKGVELGIKVDVIKSTDFNYTTQFNISHNKNTLLDLGTRTSSQYLSLSGNLQGGVYGVLTPSQEVGQFYGYNITGLTQASDFTNGVPNYPFPASGQVADQRPGNWKYEDTNHDGVINDADRKVLGHSSPDYTYGWNNDISYKGFGLNLFFTGSQGNSILNVTRYYLNNGLINNGGIIFNQTQDWYDHRWTAQNPTTDVRYPGTQTSAASSDINSTMVENGSYFRLKQAVISYALPSFKTIKNIKVFLTATNVFTITKYKGFDPEVSNFGTGLLQQGIDYGAYPQQRSYTIGISANF